MSRKELFPSNINQAPFAVADAMMDAQANYIENQGFNFNRKKVELKTLGQVESGLESWSYQLCHIGSRHAAEYLIGKYKHLFSGIALMTGSGPFKQRWNWHEVFIARDKSGIWYIGSPANFSLNDERNRMDKVISAPSVSEAMAFLIDQDAGVWASPDFIQDVFDNDPRVLPISSPPDGFYEDGIKISYRNHVSDERYLVGDRFK